MIFSVPSGLGLEQFPEPGALYEGSMSVSSFAGTPSADSKWAQLERQFPDSGGSDKSVSGRSGHKSVSGRSEDQFTASGFLEPLSWKMIVNPE